ncbi:MAG: hypothetical protein U9Q04_01670 [Campylobacterota bacterium]|nr:hypothetical protein [Campylobacterota bacterium]
METNNKKYQIIKCYFQEILPFFEHQKQDEQLKIEANIKFGSLNDLKSTNLSNHIDYKLKDDDSIELDLENSSINDIYKGLKIIQKTILKN